MKTAREAFEELKREKLEREQRAAEASAARTLVPPAPEQAPVDAEREAKVRELRAQLAALGE